MTEKACTTCLEVKPLDEFAKRKDRPGGHVARCKSCTREYNKRHYEKNKARISQKRKETRESDLDNRLEQERQYREENADRINENARHRRRQNPEQHAQYSKNYREQNRDALNQRRRDWGEQNRERRNAYERDRRARQKDERVRDSQSGEL